MMAMRNVWPFLVLTLPFFLVGCGRGHSPADEHGHEHEPPAREGHTGGEAPKKPGHEDHSDHEAGESQAEWTDAEEGHAGHGHAEEGHQHEGASGADFDEEAGIRLSKPAREMIGLGTADVSERTLALEFTATVRVFHAAHRHGEEVPGYKDGHAYANAIIPAEMANRLEVGQNVQLDHSSHVSDEKFEARLSGLDRETARAIGQVEAVIEISDPDERLEFGTFLTARFASAERDAMVIPRSALVDAATGTFVYAQNGERWLRTPVKVAGANERYVEILDGLFEGDIVASTGAIDLWLVELRFTKGGGHSH